MKSACSTSKNIEIYILNEKVSEAVNYMHHSGTNSTAQEYMYALTRLKDVMKHSSICARFSIYSYFRPKLALD